MIREIKGVGNKRGRESRGFAYLNEIRRGKG